MRLWNTLTGTREPFTAGQVVRMYVCGITPYATTHLGHARTYLLFDVLIRELERRGHIVRYVQNVTDVDDPLYEKARELGQTSAELAAKFTRVFQKDMAALGIRRPDLFPYVSREIAEIQRLIGRLLAQGHAYVRGDRVYYRVRSFPDYGKLSRLERARMIQVGRERGEDPTDPRKEDPLDFVLWKPSRPDEDTWPSPWGSGRPGWHVECSAMALKYLGPELDIHGGGSDLIYPHHDNEIAQSEAATSHTPFARFWVHVEMVRLGGVKMSKSLGNLVLVDSLLSRFSPAALRHYLLSVHYRAPLDYDEASLRQSAQRIDQLERALSVDGRPDEAAFDEQARRFDAALADDLDTPTALAALEAAARLLLSAAGGSCSGDAVAKLQGMAARLGLTLGKVPERLSEHS